MAEAKMLAGVASPDAGKHSGHGRLAGDALWRAFGRSVKNNLVAEFGVQAVRIGGFILLARLLSPDAFGILRVLIAVSSIAMILNAVGVPEALIQRAELTADHEATAWWMSVAMGLLTAVLLYTGAPLLARAMAMPSLTPFVRLISWPILLGGTTAVASARLRRRFQFAVLATADVLAEIGFVVVALILIACGQRYWSLAGGLAARGGIQALTLVLSERYWPRRWPTMAALKELIGFSSTVLSARLLTTLAGNADYLLVGRLLGTTALGFYGMAWDLLRFIPDRLYSVVGRVTLPTFCSLQDNREGLERAYCDFTNYIARLILPLIACATIAAPQLIALIYGKQWVPAALPMRMLGAGLALLGLRMAIGSVYFAKGRPSFDLYLHTLRLTLIVVVVTATARGGLLAVSAGMGLVEALVSVGGQMLVCQLTELRLRNIAAATIPGLRVALLCGLAALVAKVGSAVFALPQSVELIPIVLLPAAVFCYLEVGTVYGLVGKAFGGKSEPLGSYGV